MLPAQPVRSACVTASVSRGWRAWPGKPPQELVYVILLKRPCPRAVFDHLQGLLGNKSAWPLPPQAASRGAREPREAVRRGGAGARTTIRPGGAFGAGSAGWAGPAGRRCRGRTG